VRPRESTHFQGQREEKELKDRGFEYEQFEGVKGGLPGVGCYPKGVLPCEKLFGC